MRVYATSSDYFAAFPADSTDDIEPFLRTASRLVYLATRMATYDVDSSGKPSDPTISAAFTEATVLHANAMIGAGITNPAAGAAGLPGQVASSSIGSASITYARNADADTARVALLSGLCEDARWALDSAGLLSGTVRTW